MKAIDLLIVVPVIAVGMTGCTGNDKAPDLSNTIEFTSLTGHKTFVLEDTAQEFGRDSDICFRDSASVMLPKVLFGLDVKPLRDRIMEIAFDTVCPDAVEAMNLSFTNVTESLGYNAVETTEPYHIEDIDGFSYVQADVYSLTSHRLTYSVSTYTYNPGAAHGMQNRSFITYDLTTGDIVTLDNLFTAEGLKELPSMISRRAKRLEQQLGPTSINALPTNGDFYVSLEDEIVFVYQPYEVASYAQGMIYVPFYPYELSEYLSTRGLAFFGLDDN